MRHDGLVSAAGLAMAAIVSGALVHAGETPLTTERIVNGLSSPIFLTHAPGDTAPGGRLFVLERPGRIRIIENGVLLPTPFLDITSDVSTTFEGGLLGMAFHPDYADNGYFYLNYTAPPSGGFSLVTRVVRFEVSKDDPNVADPNSDLILLSLGQPAANHNGGWIGFSPNDDYLYVALGDGGFGAGGGGGASQDVNNLLGKMLRIDVNGDDFPADPTKNYAIPPTNPFVGKAGADEVWALGLRNPYRSGFDRETGDLWIGDVGGGGPEEISFQPASSTGGENYGWSCAEGFDCNGGTVCSCDDPDLVSPVHDYTHAFGCAVMGGLVYRGCAIPDLAGTYFFADYCSARIWSFVLDGGEVTAFQERTSELAPGKGLSINNIVSFGEDAYGELYICDFGGGEVYKIVPEVAPPDGDRDGVPDTCENSPADLNSDGFVNAADLALLLGAWGKCAGCPADLTGDDLVNAADLAILLGAWSM